MPVGNDQELSEEEFKKRLVDPKETREVSEEEFVKLVKPNFPEDPGFFRPLVGQALEGMAAIPKQGALVMGKLAEKYPRIGNAMGLGVLSGVDEAVAGGLDTASESVYPPETRGRGGFTEDVGGGVGSVLGAAPAMALGPLAASIQFGAQTGVPLYYDIKASTGDEKKAMLGLLFGNAVGQLEKIPGAEKALGGILGKLTKKGVAEAVEKLTMRTAAMGVAGKMAGESGQEAIQTALEDTIFESLTDEERDTWENVKRVIPVAAMTGGAFGAVDLALQSAKARQGSQEAQGGPEAPAAPKEPSGGPTGPVEPQVSPEAPLEPAAPTEAPVSPEGPVEGGGPLGKPSLLEQVEQAPEGVGETLGETPAAAAIEQAPEASPDGPKESDLRAAERHLEPPKRAAPESTRQWAKAADELGTPEVTKSAEVIPEKLHAYAGGVSGEDVAADVKSLAARLKARAGAMKEDTDRLGNRVTLSFQRWWTNRMAPYERIDKGRKDFGAEVDAEADVISQEDLRKGRTKAQFEKAEKTLLTPIEQHIKASGINPSPTGIDEDPGVDAYLIARHAENRNKLIEKREGKGGIGMSTEDANRILAAVESGPKAQAYKELGRRFDRMIERTRDIWVESGLESKEYVDQLRKTFKNYAPAKTDVEGNRFGTGRGTSVQGRESKSATGRQTLPDTPLAFAVSDLLRSIARAEKNHVSQVLASDVENNPNFWAGVAKVTKGRNVQSVVDGKIRSFPDPSIRTDPNVIAFKRNGEQHYIEFSEEYSSLARALNNADVQMAEGVQQFIGALSAVTRVFAKLRTALSPGFLMTNLVRDTQTALFSSTMQAKGFSKALRKELLSSFKPLLDWKRTGEFKGKDSALLKEYVESGAPISYLDLKSTASIAKDIESRFREGEPGAFKKVVRTGRDILGLMEAAADITENATRFSAFKAARKQGMSIDESAVIAKNITVNFERKGELGNIVNAFYAFSSAAIGGTRLTIKMLKYPPTRKMIIAAAAGAMVWDQLMRAMMGEEEDGTYAWDNISRDQKSRYWMIPRFWTDDPRDVLKFSMPQGLNWVFYTATELGATASGDRDPAEAVANSATAMIDAFNPFGGAESALQAISPTITDPLVELQTNRDWAGRMISPEWGSGPDAYKYFPDVNPMAKATAQAINRWTGGDEYTPGTIDISPETIEHWSKFVFGGLGSFAGKVYATAEANVSGEPVDEHNIPILSRFLGEVSPWASNRRFTDYMDELRTKQRRAGSGDMRRGEKKLEPQDRRFLSEGRRVEKKLKELGEALNQARVDRNRTEESRLEREMDRVRQKFLKKALAK